MRKIILILLSSLLFSHSILASDKLKTHNNIFFADPFFGLIKSPTTILWPKFEYERQFTKNFYGVFRWYDSAAYAENKVDPIITDNSFFYDCTGIGFRLRYYFLNNFKGPNHIAIGLGANYYSYTMMEFNESTIVSDPPTAFLKKTINFF